MIIKIKELNQYVYLGILILILQLLVNIYTTILFQWKWHNNIF